MTRRKVTAEAADTAHDSAHETAAMATIENPIETGLALQEQSLRLLMAEMQALVAMMPGTGLTHPTEAETEDGFDNMPV
jgi:hypothetical protein